MLFNRDPTNDTAKAAVQSFASSLAGRFSPVVGCTRSWDNTTDETDFEVIIDNMMNLEVLFASANLTGNSTLREIATSHADKTMQNHIRSDGEVSMFILMVPIMTDTRIVFPRCRI